MRLFFAFFFAAAMTATVASAAELLVKPADISLSLSKRNIGAITLTHTDLGEIMPVRQSGCASNGVAWISHVQTIRGKTFEQLKVSVKAYHEGVCDLQFTAGALRATVRVLVGP